MATKFNFNPKTPQFYTIKGDKTAINLNSVDLIQYYHSAERHGLQGETLIVFYKICNDGEKKEITRWSWNNGSPNQDEFVKEVYLELTTNFFE